MTLRERQQNEIERALRQLKRHDDAFGNSATRLMQLALNESLLSSKTIRFFGEQEQIHKDLTARGLLVAASATARRTIETALANLQITGPFQSAAFDEGRLAWISKYLGELVHYRHVPPDPETAFNSLNISKQLLELVASNIANSRVDLSKLGTISGSSALAALDFSTFTDNLGQLESIKASYSGQLAGALRDLLDEQDVSDASTDHVNELISEKVRSLPQGIISAEGLLTVVFTVIAVLWAYGYFNKADRADATAKTRSRRSKHLDKLVESLVVEASRLIPQLDLGKYYLVDREASLRSKPDAKSAVLGSLSPNRKVRVVQNNHKWLYVEYFDEIQGVLEYGWSLKKYFKRVQAPNQRARAFITNPQPVNSVSSITDDERLAITDRWEETNTRRVELIKRLIDKKISVSEQTELDYLQHLTDERIRLLAPLPRFVEE
ncbi:MAG TPA: SH3 domain-containing protein [Pyrinomonadaceae bacterium]